MEATTTPPRAATAAQNGAEEPSAPKPSRLDDIRRKRNEIAQNKTLTLKVEGYDDALWVRYKAVPGEEITELAERIERSKDPKRLLQVSADTVIRCCEAVLVSPDGGKEFASVDPDGDTVTFSSAKLPELLGFEAETARDEVFAIFSPGGAHPLAVTRHGNALISWLQGQLEDIDRELLGE